MSGSEGGNGRGPAGAPGRCSDGWLFRRLRTRRATGALPVDLQPERTILALGHENVVFGKGVANLDASTTTTEIVARPNDDLIRVRRQVEVHTILRENRALG